ncbi:MAG: cytochrome c [Planctomycetales bacterium]|nr:cytochrome c [Planctomycetales bacterium]
MRGPSRAGRLLRELGIGTALAAAAAGCGRGGPPASLGERVYERDCASCHGAAGDGAGPAAAFLDPRPRDFRAGRLRYHSGPPGSVPSDADLERVVLRGIPGTAMPGSRWMSEEERRAVVQRVKAFSARFREESPRPPAAVPPDPWADPWADPWGRAHDAAVARGRALYHARGGCADCHPSYLTDPPGDRKRDTKDEDGSLLLPPDFLRQRLKVADTPEGLWRAISWGVGGTAMPAVPEGLSEGEVWALVHYVRSLGRERTRRLWRPGGTG